MRLLVEIVVIGALICFGWNTPFKEWVAESRAMLTSKIHAPPWEDKEAKPSEPPATRTQARKPRSNLP